MIQLCTRCKYLQRVFHEKNMTTTHRIEILDTHTGGEPTRIVIAGAPDLGSGPMSERARVFRENFDEFRSCVVNEPRGSDVMVGALLLKAHDKSCVAGVIFFNNVGVLGMCGHGSIGVGVALQFLGRAQSGRHRLETPVGNVEIDLQSEHRIAVENVPSYRFRKNVKVEIEEYGAVTGDIAWGGNWFFLVGDYQERIASDNIARLTDVSWRFRQALQTQNIRGRDGGEIDHIELFGAPSAKDAHSKSFVLCPGAAYDRSPCGTGTSAKIACLAADGKLKAGEIWVQESVIGSTFEAWYRNGSETNVIVPTIAGTAWITGQGVLIVQDGDPFANGIRLK